MINMYKKLNNKGYMLVEIIIASAIAFSITYYLLNLTYKFKNINEDVYVSTVFENNKILIVKNIMNDISNNKIINIEQSNDKKTITLTLEDNSKKRIEINNRTITYGNYNGTSIQTNDKSYYTKTINNSLEVGTPSINQTEDNSKLKIIIPISSIYSKKTYSIKLYYKCDQNLIKKKKTFFSVSMLSLGGIINPAGIGNVYEVTENENSWSTVDTGQKANSVSAVDENTFYMVGSLSLGGIVDPAGIGNVYEVTKNGDSWSAVDTGQKANSVSAVDENTFYMVGSLSVGRIIDPAGIGNIYKVTKNGNSWSTVDTGQKANSVSAVDDNTFYMVGSLSIPGGSTDSAGIGNIYEVTKNENFWNSVDTGIKANSVSAIDKQTFLSVGLLSSGGIIDSAGIGNIYQITKNENLGSSVDTGLKANSVSAIDEQTFLSVGLLSSGGIIDSAGIGNVYQITKNENLGNSGDTRIKANSISAAKK